MNIKKNNRFAFILLSVLIFSFAAVRPSYADTSSTEPVPYGEDEFPAWAKDLRRAEIITFGSLPFTTLFVNIGFGIYKVNTGAVSSFSPFDYSNYTEDEQKQILGISCAVSAGVGLADWTFNFIRRANDYFTVKRQKEMNRVTVLPELEDPDKKEENPVEDESKAGEE